MDKKLYELKKVLAELTKAASDEHDRLQSDLDAWAAGRSFSNSYPALPSGKRPDVLRSDKEKKYLFIGDAKNAENETCKNAETCDRLDNYFKEFAEFISVGWQGGTLAVATNTESDANNWVQVLNTLAMKNRLVNADQSRAVFRVEKISSKKTWIIFW